MAKKERKFEIAYKTQRARIKILHLHQIMKYASIL
jgi:hypothetical protein